MGFLDFLSNQSLASNAAVKPATNAAVRSRSSVEKNPTDADIRVFRNGAVYPSLALIQQDELAYLNKDQVGVAFGYDLIDSSKFLNTKNWPQKLIFIAKVPKSEPKVDLFGRTTYDENGMASDVATQGATTAGKDLLVMLEEVYGYTIPEGESFVDLKIVTDHPMTTDDNIYFLPKTIARGERKGQYDLIRREDLVLNALAPVSVLAGTVQPEAIEADPEVAAHLDANISGMVEAQAEAEELLEVPNVITNEVSFEAEREDYAADSPFNLDGDAKAA